VFSCGVGNKKSDQFCFVVRVLTTVELELTRFGGVTFQMLNHLSCSVCSHFSLLRFL
jgi:hypothetical protein